MSVAVRYAFVLLLAASVCLAEPPGRDLRGRLTGLLQRFDREGLTRLITSAKHFLHAQYDRALLARDRVAKTLATKILPDNLTESEKAAFKKRAIVVAIVGSGAGLGFGIWAGKRLFKRAPRSGTREPSPVPPINVPAN
ncbi:unnamed protein product (mitochondrion) [Plasmodiophora brassicae]|uniref:Secreted protein n=1 Tax=Plasmodiophora brassicae TaxID=37360 RepID=A0A0G4IUC8_PLABS|nr:hypothetical protein PBRA_006956 [Plasmodiophora brassicae]SPR00540.1 unnamed protein product [Plasmodiophora brassicae]